MLTEPPAKILVVDDNKANLVALQAVLQVPGWDLVLASSGKEALRHLLAADFAVILLDVQMSEMDGIETATLIKQRDRCRSTPIIFLTAHDEDCVHAFRGYSAGAVDYLRKPAVPEILRAKVRVFVDLHRKTEEVRRVEAALRRTQVELEQHIGERVAELALLNRDLAQRNQEIETFVYSVSHDLRSPLVNLQGFSKELGLSCNDLRAILAESDLPDEVRRRTLALVDQDMGQSIHFIQSAVMRLSNIIDALLRLSRAGRLEPQWQSLDLNVILTRIVESLKATIAERGAEVHVQPLPSIHGDPTSVERIFGNLLTNALTYLDPKRPGRIEVGAAASPPHETSGARSESRTYFVRDNGVGIPAASAPKVFQAFQRFRPDLAEGEGMGLAICHRLVARHGGKIWFESTVGAGTTFFVALPVHPPAAAASSVPNSPMQARGPRAPA